MCPLYKLFHQSACLQIWKSVWKANRWLAIWNNVCEQLECCMHWKRAANTLRLCSFLGARQKSKVCKHTTCLYRTRVAPLECTGSIQIACYMKQCSLEHTVCKSMRTHYNHAIWNISLMKRERNIWLPNICTMFQRVEHSISRHILVYASQSEERSRKFRRDLNDNLPSQFTRQASVIQLCTAWSPSWLTYDCRTIQMLKFYTYSIMSVFHASAHNYLKLA